MPEWLSSLSVTTASAWWALLALGIPLLIHLFSRSRGRLVRIGHIDLIRQARKIRVTEVKLTQWLLLLLRLAIFTLAALILVGLATPGLNSSKEPTSYLTPAWLSGASEDDINSILSIASQTDDSRVLLLQPGFPPADREQLETGRQLPSPAMGDLSNTWSLLSERLSLEHHRGEVTVYATDYMLQFGSRRPALPRDVDWRLRRAEQTPVVAPRASRALVTFEPDRVADAARIGAVLAVLREHRLPELTWESIASAQLADATANADWIIHLGDTDLDPAQLPKTISPGVIFNDAGGSTPEMTKQFVHVPFYPFTSFRVDRFTRHVMNKPGEHRANEREVLLASADGSPLLTESHDGPLRLLKFNSRFDSNWSSLAQQAEFPELLLQLMSGTQQDHLRFSDARVSPLNIQNTHEQSSTDLPLPRRSLQRLLATLLAFFWLGERWLSERKPRERR